MIVEETTHKIRDVMADLNPPVLDEYGLMAAIKWYSGDFTNRTGITTQVSGDKSDLQLGTEGGEDPVPAGPGIAQQCCQTCPGKPGGDRG